MSVIKELEKVNIIVQMTTEELDDKMKMIWTMGQ